MKKILSKLLPGLLIVWALFSAAHVFASNASMDTSFDTKAPLGFNSYATTMSMQSDGKLFAFWAFSTYQWASVSKFFRINADGTRDTTFNVWGGFNIYYNNPTDFPLVSAVQSDGKVLVAWPFDHYSGSAVNQLIRLNADGSRDTGFNVWGAGFNQYDIPTSIAVQPDGKIIVGGAFTKYNWTAAKQLIRLNTYWSIDGTFSAWWGFDQGPTVITVQSDWKILLGGWFIRYQWVAANHIIRLNADWSRDASFSMGSAFQEGSAHVSAIKTQSDGKIIVGWHFTAYNATANINRIVRLNTDWSLDSSFNAWWAWFDNDVKTISIDTWGKIIVGGSFSTYNWVSANRIIRLNTNGSNDSSLSIWVGFSNDVLWLAIQSNGQIVAIGSFTSYNWLWANRIIRINTDWSRDSLYLGNGLDWAVTNIKVQSNGKILIAGGFSVYSWIATNGITRFNGDGSIDTNFHLTTPFDGTIRTLAVQSDGKVIVGGEFTKHIARLNTDGSVDSSFNAWGAGFDGVVLSMAVDTNNKVIVWGNFTTYNWSTASKLIRLNSDGSVDSSFDVGSTINNIVRSILIQGDGKILVGGTFAGWLVRFNTDWSVDATASIWWEVDVMWLQSDGKIVFGSSNITKHIGRLNTNLTQDGTFNVWGWFDLGLNTLLIQNDDKIIVGCDWSSYQWFTLHSIIGLNADWSIDTSFDIWLWSNLSVNSLAAQSDWKVLVGGNFTRYNTSIAWYFMRLYWNAAVVNLPNSSNQSIVTQAFTDQGYTVDNGSLVWSTPISLSGTNGSIPTTLDITNQTVNISIPSSTQVKKSAANYSWIISVPVWRPITSVNDEHVITAFNVGGTSDSISLIGWVATLSIPLPGKAIGKKINVYYSIDNWVSWYLEISTQVIDINGSPYIQFTTNHFGDFAITEAPTDTTAPVITLIWSSVININLHSTYTDSWATATDNIDGDITANIVVSGSVNTSTSGSYILTYNVSDAAGNPAIQVTRTVNVIPDTTAPGITLNGDAIVSVDQNSTYTDAWATATDNVDGDISANIVVSGSVDTATTGTYILTYTVSDAAGNPATPITRTVLVSQIGELNNINIVSTYGCWTGSTNCAFGRANITRIAPNAFVNHPNLQSLSIYNNNIPTIESGAFNGLSSLNSLEFYSNQIAYIETGAFDGMSQLTYLDINDNKLSSIPNQTISALTQLTYLDLGWNGITSLQSADIEKLPAGLQELYLYSNQITKLSKWVFSSLSQLSTTLDLDNNYITIIETGAFDGLTNLNTLDISYNQISVIKKGLFDWLSHLINLYLNNNQISSIETDSFYNLGQLNSLNIQYNKMMSIQSGMFNGLQHISSLYFSSNPLHFTETGAFDSLLTLNSSFDLSNSCSTNNILITTSSCTNPTYADQVSCEADWYCSDGASTDKASCESTWFVCTDGVSTDQASCENQWYCTDGVSTDQASCESKWFVCSDPAFTDQASCEALIEYCSDPAFTDQASCQAGGYSCTNKNYATDQAACQANWYWWGPNQWVSYNNTWAQSTRINAWNTWAQRNYTWTTYNVWNTTTLAQSQMDTNYCSFTRLDSATFNNELINKWYSIGGGLLSLGSDYHVWYRALEFSNANQLVSNVVMQSTNDNGYSDAYYTSPLEVQYASGTSLTYNGAPFTWVLVEPEAFSTTTVTGISGVVSLMRFGALTHRVDFSQPVSIRMPALGEATGSSVSIYSSDKENIFGTNTTDWAFEQTGTIIDINWTPYVQFTTNHDGRYALGTLNPIIVPDTGSNNTGSNNTGSNNWGGSNGGGSNGGWGGGSSLGLQVLTQQTTPNTEVPKASPSIKGSRYPTEINNAYLWAYGFDITTQASIQKANIDGKLIRKDMAKMISNFAVNVLKKTISNTGTTCTFTDTKNLTKEAQTYATAACKLGLMWYASDGKTLKTTFDPNAEVDRAQFGTILSRLLYGDKNNASSKTTPYYANHLDALKDAWVMSKINTPTQKELRGYVMLMMMRSVTK